MTDLGQALGVVTIVAIIIAGIVLDRALEHDDLDSALDGGDDDGALT